MFFFDPDNLQFTVMRETNDEEPAVLVRIVGFASHDEANLFSNQLLALHGETQSQTVH